MAGFMDIATPSGYLDFVSWQRYNLGEKVVLGVAGVVSTPKTSWVQSPQQRFSVWTLDDFYGPCGLGPIPLTSMQIMSDTSWTRSRLTTNKDKCCQEEPNLHFIKE